MTDAEQIKAFEADVAKLCDRYIDDMTVASMIGVLMMQAANLRDSVPDDDEEDES